MCDLVDFPIVSKTNSISFRVEYIYIQQICSLNRYGIEIPNEYITDNLTYVVLYIDRVINRLIEHPFLICEITLMRSLAISSHKKKCSVFALNPILKCSTPLFNQSWKNVSDKVVIKAIL